MPEDKPVEAKEPTPVAKPATNSTATNGLAVAAMVVGIVAFFSGWVPFWGLVAGIVAVVLGILALKKPAGKGMSITGIATGGVAIVTNLIFISLFIITIIAGSAVVDEVHNQIQEENTSTQEKIDAEKDFAKGETAVFDNFEVKINSVTRNYVPESSFYQPEEGNEYIVLNITVKNVGDENEIVGPYAFSVKDAGAATDSAFVTVSPEFKSDTLYPQASITGNIVYEVTKDSTDLKLQYETVVYDSANDSKVLVYTLAI